MRVLLVVIAIGLTGGRVSAAEADCDAARCSVLAGIDAGCLCDLPTSHARHMMCVRRVLRQLDVPRPCRAAIVRCAAGPACGRPRASGVLATRCGACPSSTTTSTIITTTTTSTLPLHCGNHVLEPGEDCDPPGMFCRGGCNPVTHLCVDIPCGDDCTCPAPSCGDLVLDPEEQCDPPGSTCADGTTCSAGCACSRP